MEHFLADDGEKIYLKISGDGPPLVMLYGWTSNHQEWFPFIADLQKHHTVSSLGRERPRRTSLAGNDQPTVSRMARDLHLLLKHF